MEFTIYCNYCNKEAKITSGLELYGANHKLSRNMFYYCCDCSAWVGMHEKTKKPFGTLAKVGLRRKRVEAHAVFDPIWQEMLKQKVPLNVARKRAYEWLSKELGIDFDLCHIGQFDTKTCNQVIRICLKKSRGK